jgi:hypothetical protein
MPFEVTPEWCENVREITLSRQDPIALSFRVLTTFFARPRQSNKRPPERKPFSYRRRDVA